MLSVPSGRKDFKAETAILGVAALALTACGGGGGDGSAAEFDLLIHAENSDVPEVLTALSGEQCSDENEELALDIETVPQANLDQQLQLLAGQGGLPKQFSAGNAPSLTEELEEAGHVLDLEETFEDLGIMESVEPAALSTIEALYGSFNVLPYEYNIEGFWYNRELFEEHGIEIPETWDELLIAAETFHADGILPFSVSGEQGWPITRFISNYLFRTVGPDALQRVADGEASLTDPEYVEAAAAVAEVGEAGYFGQGVGSIDMDTSTNEFMNGNAAMFYMGSWALSDFRDGERNVIGEDVIEFMPFPDVEGGEGDRSQIAANVGLPLSINANTYDENVGAWLTCISENYGPVALEDNNRVTGFAFDEEEVETEPLVDVVQEQISSTDETVLWFEALFTTAATTTSQQNAAQLVNGSMSPEEFMELVESDL